MPPTKSQARRDQALQAAYERQLQERGFRSDPAQLAAVDALEDLRSRLIAAGSATPSGAATAVQARAHEARRAQAQRRPSAACILWGGVGRGKTWLMDLFFQSLPFPREAPPPLPSLHVRRARAAEDARRARRRRSKTWPRSIARRHARALLRRVLRHGHRGRDDSRHAVREPVPPRRHARRHIQRAAEGSVQGWPAARALPAGHRAAGEEHARARRGRRHRLPPAPAHAGRHLPAFRRPGHACAPRSAVHRARRRRARTTAARSRSKAARSRWSARATTPSGSSSKPSARARAARTTTSSSRATTSPSSSPTSRASPRNAKTPRAASSRWSTSSTTTTST